MLFFQFNTLVENVALDNTGDLDQWIVTITDLKSSEIKEYTFDAVIVCNG